MQMVIPRLKYPFKRIRSPVSGQAFEGRRASSLGTQERNKRKRRTLWGCKTDVLLAGAAEQERPTGAGVAGSALARGTSGSEDEGATAAAPGGASALPADAGVCSPSPCKTAAWLLPRVRLQGLPPPERLFPHPRRPPLRLRLSLLVPPTSRFPISPNRPHSPGAVNQPSPRPIPSAALPAPVRSPLSPYLSSSSSSSIYIRSMPVAGSSTPLSRNTPPSPSRRTTSLSMVCHR